MRTVQRLAAVIVATLLAVPLFALHGDAAPGDGTVTFPQIGGTVTHTISLPKRALVLSEKFDLEGLPDLGPVRTSNYDFTDSTNNQGWDGLTASSPPAGNPTGYQQNQFGDYSEISGRDGNFHYTWSDWGGTDLPYQLYKFKVKEKVLQSFTAEWTGYGWWWDLDWWDEGYGADLFVWNAGTNQWEKMGSTTGTPGTISAMKNVNPGSYLDANNYIYLLAISTMQNGGFMYYELGTDYVKLSVTGQDAVWPSSPTLDIGDDGASDWSFTGVFKEKATVSDDNTRAAIQSAIDATGGGDGNFSLAFKFASTTGGKIKVSNVTIDLDTPPRSPTGIPSTFALDEDTTAAKLIDLNQFFTDDRDSGKLQYAVAWMEDRAKLEAVLNPDGHSLDFKTGTKDWNGMKGFRISATDSSGQNTTSATFNVTVRPLNDKPALTSKKPIQSATQDKLFEFTYTARDVDGDPITFSDNSTLFDIDAAKGKISFTPRNADVGVYKVKITVTDTGGLSDSDDVTLTVQNVNDPPVIDTNQSDLDGLDLRQGVPVEFTIVAHDPDTLFGDVLAFSDNTTIFNIGQADGLVRFTPTNDMVGLQRVRITVSDRSSVSVMKEFAFNIQNVNDAPVVPPIPDLQAVEDAPFEYTVNATDPDLVWGDSITFEDSSPLFVIEKTTGRIAFTPNNSVVGMYGVKITVRDKAGLAASATFNLTVANVNDPPTGLAITAPSNGSLREGERFRLSARATDIDRVDVLNYTWKEGARVIGYGENIDLTLPPGAHTVTLEVSDGNDTATADYTLTVQRKPAGLALTGGGGALPLLPLLLVVVLVGAAVAAGVAVSRRRKARQAQEAAQAAAAAQAVQTPQVSPEQAYHQQQYQQQGYYQPQAYQYDQYAGGGYGGAGTYEGYGGQPAQSGQYQAAGQMAAYAAPRPEEAQADGPRYSAPAKVRTGEPVAKEIGLSDVKKLLATAEETVADAKARGVDTANADELILHGKRHAYRGEYRLAKESLQRALELANR